MGGKRFRLKHTKGKQQGSDKRPKRSVYAAHTPGLYLVIINPVYSYVYTRIIWRTVMQV
jgi:hypothetical protein